MVRLLLFSQKSFPFDIKSIKYLGIHAREWIAGSMATYLINELTKPGGAINIIDHLNIHVLPIANPDGYEYSRNSERLWRKTRSETGSSLGCMGVDGNRNWDFHWGGRASKVISTFRYSVKTF